jgi:two-component system sensor histidine kinase KdpD
VLGVLGFMPKTGILSLDEKEQLEAVTSVAASALERVSVAELAEKRKVEAEGEKMRNALLSSVSHDLRTPLASIKGAISSMMIDNTLSSDSRMELLASVHNETTRLERIVSNLLDVTLLESGRLQLKKDYYFMSELVGNALHHTKELLKEHTVECAFDEGMPALWVDGLLIEQVLVNLLENTAKYSPPDSPILIDAWTEEGNIRIIVADRGPGIHSGDEQKLFDKFYRGTQSGHGSGLGLAICRGIIEAHGGKITARKREGGGAVFSFVLPAVQAPDVLSEVAA